MNSTPPLWKLIVRILLVGFVIEGFIGFAVYCVATNHNFDSVHMAIFIVVLIITYAIITILNYRDRKDDDNDDDNMRVNF